MKYDPRMHKNYLWDPKTVSKIIFSHFGAVLDQNLILKKKVSKICPNLAKNEKNIRFLKFQLWLFGRRWPIFGRKTSQKFRLASNSYQKFFYHPNSKIGENIPKHLPPPWKVHFSGGSVCVCGGGGGRVKLLKLMSWKTEVSQHDDRKVPVWVTLPSTLKSWYKVLFITSGFKLL